MQSNDPGCLSYCPPANWDMALFATHWHQLRSDVANNARERQSMIIVGMNQCYNTQHHSCIECVQGVVINIDLCIYYDIFM